MFAGPGAHRGGAGLGLSMEELRSTFREFDLDKNGYVGAAEIAHVLKSMGETPTDDEIDEMIFMADLDGDGQVSFEEFAKFMSALNTPRPPPGMPGASRPGAPPAPYGASAYGAYGAGPAVPYSDPAAYTQAPYGVGAFVPSAQPGSLLQASVPLQPSGNPVQDMETFQRVNGMDAAALRRIYLKFQEADRVRALDAVGRHPS